MAAVEYGTIGIRPMGTYDSDTKYGLLNLVDYDGSSYVAHTDPPLGTLPTNLSYWQVSAQGTGKATDDSVGTVKPDGTTTEVSADGSLSVKTATQNALGLVKGSNGIKVGTDGSIDVNTLFTQATELANIIAEEAISTVLGKISKAIAVTIGLNENALLKNMLTNMDANDQNKIPTAAFVHKLYERIGMSEDLEIGTSLTNAVKLLNSNLTVLSGDVYWKRINASAVQGSATVTIPASAKEIRVCITYNDQFWQNDVQTSLLTTTAQIVFIGGNYYDNSNYNTISANVSKSSVQMRLVWVNGLQKINDSFMVVFYR